MRWTPDDVRAAGWCPETGTRLNPANRHIPPSARDGDRRVIAESREAVPADTSKARPGRSGASGNGTEPRQPRKYRNVPTAGLDGTGATVRYDSKREAKLAAELNARQAKGLIRSWVRQVSLPIGPDENGREVRARIDALVIHEALPNGRFVGEFTDPKGADTLHSRAKRAALRGRYGIDVKVI